MFPRSLLLLMCYVFIAAGCATAQTTKALHVPPTQGAARSEISSDKQLIDEAVSVAEKYWNAQKSSDAALFREVTPHESMKVVFDWSYVNKSDVFIEDALITGIKYHLQQFMIHHDKYEATRSAPYDPFTTGKASLAAISAADVYAESIEKGGYPMLGDLLRKGYWNTIIPKNLPDMTKYRLMKFNYITDVKVQSKGGTVLQKRATLMVYRMQCDGNDSGWKVLFCLM